MLILQPHYLRTRGITQVSWVFTWYWFCMKRKTRGQCKTSFGFEAMSFFVCSAPMRNKNLACETHSCQRGDLSLLLTPLKPPNMETPLVSPVGSPPSSAIPYPSPSPSSHASTPEDQTPTPTSGAKGSLRILGWGLGSGKVGNWGTRGLLSLFRK